MRRSDIYEKSKSVAPNSKNMLPKDPEPPQKMLLQKIWLEVDPKGLIWAHMHTVKSYLAQDNFWTPPDPKKGYEGPALATTKTWAEHKSAGDADGIQKHI